MARLVGSDIAHAVPLTFIAGIGHWTMGSVDLGLLVALLLGSIPGIVIGSLIATRISERILVPILAVTLAIVGTKLLVLRSRPDQGLDFVRHPRAGGDRGQGWGACGRSSPLRRAFAGWHRCPILSRIPACAGMTRFAERVFTLARPAG